jgi:8-oxo-dGTP diphosphatase
MGDRACVVMLKDRQVLMVHQTYRGERIWTFPGGSIEPGETPEQAAIREVREEVGLHIEIVQQLCQVPRTAASGIYYCYLGRVVGGQVQLGHDPDDHADAQSLHDVRWFPLQELRDHPEVRRIWEVLEFGITDSIPK